MKRMFGRCEAAMRHVARGLRSRVIDRMDWFRVASQMAADSHLGWRARIVGRSIEVGETCRIEDDAVICTRHERAKGDYIRIGRGCRIRRGCHLYSWQGFVRMGENCTVNTGCVIYGMGGGVTIGNNVRIAAGTVIVTSRHNIDRVDIPIALQGGCADPIVIEDDVWIGAGACVLSGVRIGSGSVIGAGAVVNVDVQPRNIVGGVPARVMRVRE